MNCEVAYKVIFDEYPDVVNIGQLRQMLGGIGQKAAYRLVKSGEIQNFTIGGAYRIPKVNVLKYLRIIEG